MKTKNLVCLALCLIGLALFAPAVALAQDAAPAAAEASTLAAPKSLPDNIVSWLTPLVVPVVLAGVKQFLPKLPSWSMPLLAPVLGFLIGVINNFATQQADNLWLAAGLGLLGVAVREVKEAVKPAANGGWPTP